MFDLLIRHTDLLQTLPTVEAVRDQDIAIRGTQIAALAPGGTLPVEQAAHVIEATGMLAAPGLINAHAHVPMVLFRGLAEDVSIENWFNDYIWHVEANLTAEDVYWGALFGIAEMIECGVTTVADHYFFMDSVAQAITESGMRALLVTAMFGTSENAETELNASTVFIERWHGAAEGRIRAWLGPHSTYICPEPFLRKVAERAKAIGTGVHIHVSETREQVTASLAKTGRTPVEMLKTTGLLDSPTIAAHVAHPSHFDLQILSDHDVGTVHCPKTFLKLAAGMSPILTLRDQGISVAFGTDGAASNNTLDILEAARLAALVQKHERRTPTVATINETLQMAFIGGAEVLRLGDNFGTLAVGKTADLILIRQDGVAMQPLINIPANLLYSASARDVDTTIVNGRVLMQGRKLLTLDKAAIIREVQTRLPRLLQRLPEKRIQTYRP
jgi:5-methylthioadenosine/S-adenosylhomocysteine deaminase